MFFILKRNVILLSHIKPVKNLSFFNNYSLVISFKKCIKKIKKKKVGFLNNSDNVLFHLDHSYKFEYHKT